MALLARLEHPNIVRVFFAGYQGGRAIMAMEFCAGGRYCLFLCIGTGAMVTIFVDNRKVYLLACAQCYAVDWQSWCNSSSAIGISAEPGIVHVGLSDASTHM